MWEKTYRDEGGPEPFSGRGERLPAELRKRIRRLLADLVGNDLSMAFLDLAQLHRGLADLSTDRLANAQPAYAGSAAGRNGNSSDDEEWETFFA